VNLGDIGCIPNSCGSLARSREQGMKLRVPLKGWKFPEKLSDYGHLKKDSVSQSYL
jgi:hypothetical protein